MGEKMKFKDRYKNSPIEIKAMYIIILVSLCIFVLSIPCFFFDLASISLGLLLGLTIGFGCYMLLVYQVYNTLSFNHPKTKGVFNYLIRFLLYGLGIALALLLEYFGYKIFNVFAVFGSYFVSIITLVVVSLIIDKGGNKNEKNI